MPQTLQKCFDESERELAGWRWDADSKCVYHYKTIHRKDFRFSTGVRSETAVISQAILNKAIREANAEITRRIKAEENDKTFKPFLREIIAKVRKSYEDRPTIEGKKNHTLNTVNSSFDKIEEYWGTLFPDQITSQEWGLFQDWFDKKYPGYNSFNVTKYMRILRNYCIEIGQLKLKPRIIDRNAKIQKKKRKAKKGWVYTHADIIALDEKGCVNDMERIIIRLGYQNAFRISDALNIEWAKFRFSLRVPTYKFDGEDKEETENAVPLTEDLVLLIQAYPKVEGSPFLFPQKGNSLKPLMPQQFDFDAIKTRAGVTRGTFHSLRHYRLSNDFKDPKLTAAQVCLIRRITLATASEHYIHTDVRDLELMQNTGDLKVIKAKAKEAGDA